LGQFRKGPFPDWSLLALEKITFEPDEFFQLMVFEYLFILWSQMIFIIYFERMLSPEDGESHKL
jgi:hypothetical protein